jgi:hypothetical protein
MAKPASARATAPERRLVALADKCMGKELVLEVCDEKYNRRLVTPEKYRAEPRDVRRAEGRVPR